jgi:hypothetical protein
LAMPPRRPKNWSEAEVDPAVTGAYESLLDRLLALDFDQGERGPVPFTLRLSLEAKLRWVAFYNEWAAEQNRVEGEVAALFSKLEGYAARFALVHHVVSRVARGEDDSDPVEGESIDGAVELTRWFAYEAERIYLALAEEDGQRQARQLVDLIRDRGGRITVRELMRANCRRYPDAGTAEAALAALVSAGLTAWEEGTTGPMGGRPVRSCVLRMTHDTIDRTPSVEGEGTAGAGMTQPPVSMTEPPPALEKPARNRGCVSSVMRHTGDKSAPQTGTAPGTRPEGSVIPPPDLPGELRIDPETGEGVLEL